MALKQQYLIATGYETPSHYMVDVYEDSVVVQCGVVDNDGLFSKPNETTAAIFYFKDNKGLREVVAMWPRLSPDVVRDDVRRLLARAAV